MKLHADATGWGRAGVAQASVTKTNTEGGYVIAGAAGEGAIARASIQGGTGDVLTFATTINGRRIAMAVAIGNDPRRQDGPETTHLIGRALVRR
ncbi:hypothetical protein L6R52_17565 [Myxococcota bacterium]|nr:hypothetical protein [Myxococcota bacterium]